MRLKEESVVDAFFRRASCIRIEIDYVVLDKTEIDITGIPI